MDLTICDPQLFDFIKGLEAAADPEREREVVRESEQKLLDWGLRKGPARAARAFINARPFIIPDAMWVDIKAHIAKGARGNGSGITIDDSLVDDLRGTSNLFPG